MQYNDYKELLLDIKTKIQEAQVKTVSAANSQMLWLYWQLGQYILDNQKAEGWGGKIIERLAGDLKKEFPMLKGFSRRNLLYMKQFAATYTVVTVNRFIQIEGELKKANPITQQVVAQLLTFDNEEVIITQQPVAQLAHDNFIIAQQPAAQLQGTENTITQQPVAQMAEVLFKQCIVAKISWSHHVVLMDKEPHLGKRFWYMLNSLEHGNSRNILAIQIENSLFERQVVAKKITNFSRTLPPPQSDFANYLLKDPYIFDFVQAKEKADERNIEEQLANHVTKFLLELGQGFAFIGRQVHFEIGQQDFYADLLFYHTRLHC